jgi:hypothetical protein
MSTNYLNRCRTSVGLRLFNDEYHFEVECKISSRIRWSLSPWWRHCCCRGWITVICHLRFPSVQHPTAPCRRFRIQLPVWSSTFVAPTTSLTRLHVFMGSVSLTTPSVSVSRWRHGFSFNLRSSAILPTWVRPIYGRTSWDVFGIIAAFDCVTDASHLGRDRSFPVAGAELWNNLHC